LIIKLVPPLDSRNFLNVRELGKFIVIIGVIATLVGLVMWSGFAPKWLGRLPGDIRIEREHSSFYLPTVTCIVLSILLSLIFSLFSMFRR
jgi:H+/Cl- antiporter ClcA